MSYTPPAEILEKYAQLLVSFALNEGKGVKPGDTVFVHLPECAKPFLMHLQKAILLAKAHPIINYVPDGVTRQFFELGSEEQIAFFPSKIMKGRVDEMDHLLFIDAEADKHELEGIDAKKIMSRQKAMKPYWEWRHEKERKGKFTWCLAMYGTAAMAKEVSMTEQQYWEQIIRACYLDEKDPVQKWKEIQKENHRVRDKLTALQIEKVRVVGAQTDLTIGLGKNRKWLGFSGHNIPSYEVFISPDCRLTEGHIKFNNPLYRYGNLITNVRLEFKKGKVVKATAEQGEDILKQMIATPGADMVGEFSLTDSRLSRITKFMGETLYDENAGGQFGNTHVALGNAYTASYPGNQARVTKAQWKKMGYNTSIVHTDIISTEDRTVTATLKNGKEVVIYKDGKFTI
jgi:aminopeptidase